jgi:hypothetical protein
VNATGLVPLTLTAPTAPEQAWGGGAGRGGLCVARYSRKALSGGNHRPVSRVADYLTWLGQFVTKPLSFLWRSQVSSLSNLA